MNRRSFIVKGVGAAAAAAIDGPRLALAQGAPRRNFNLVYILADQHSGMATPMAGDPMARTPNIQRLAEEGVTFTHAFTAGMTCGPSRACLETGLHHQTNGVRPGASLPEGVDTLFKILLRHDFVVSQGRESHIEWLRMMSQSHLEWLKTLGYREVESSAVGSPLIADLQPWPVWSPVGRAGLAPEHTFDAYTAQTALRFLEEHRHRRFACIVQFRGPHDPYVTPRPFDALFDPPMPPYRAGEFTAKPKRQATAYADQGMNRLTDEQIRKILAIYYGMVTLTDKLTGLVLDRVRELGLEENTIVVYLADHGDTMGRHRLFSKGFAFYEPSMRIPLILSGPGCPKGRRFADLVSGIDILPTLLELLDLPPAPGVQGRSLVPYWEKGFSHPHRTIFAGQGYEGFDRAVMVRDPKWKLNRYDEGGWELYDLEHDPDELTNLHGEPRYASTVEALTEELSRWDRQYPHMPPRFPPTDTPERIGRINAAFEQWRAKQL